MGIPRRGGLHLTDAPGLLYIFLVCLSIYQERHQWLSYRYTFHHSHRHRASTMKVLLVGCTGNLGTRCLQALLAHNHTVVLYVRNPAKLHKLVSPDVIQRIAAIVLGDATDAASLLAALQDHAVDAIVDVAGNQVLPWQEQVLPKITRSVTKAAVATGRARGRPLRAWFVTGINVLEYPGAPGLLTDYGGL
jgi:NADPH:quinone reductase-like Zn-dependent oxidoreductase